MANVSEYKKKLVQDMTKLMKSYSMIGMVNMEDMPAPQLQAMRSELRGKIELFMTKKRLMRIALEKMKSEKKGIEELEKHFQGMPALIFSNENPFKLSRLLAKSKTKAPAKAGQEAPEDIVVNKGPTPFAPGPVISELSSVGLKVGVEGGKVAVKEDTVIVKKGEKIKPKVAEILARLDIKPMEVGLGLVAAYEDGLIYQKDILDVDEEEYANNINLAASQAFNLAFNITYVTKDNISILIGKAFNDSKALGLSQEIFDSGIVEDLLSKAEREMLSLKGNANIEVTEKPKEEKLIEEQPKPAEKAEEKPVEVKKEEPKAEEKKIETPTLEKLEKKEEKILKEEKKIIEEEKKLEEEKPKDAPIEKLSSESEKGLEKEDAFQKEVQEEVKKEEEKKLEAERIEKEKELEKVEQQKEEIKKPEVPPKEEVDEKVSKMVESTKKFMKGEKETAADIIEEVEKEELAGGKPEIQEKPPEAKVQEAKPEVRVEHKPAEKAEEKPVEVKIEEPQPEVKTEVSTATELKEKGVPSAHDLKKNQEQKETKQDKEHKEVEELTKELLKKGTLRKK